MKLGAFPLTTSVRGPARFSNAKRPLRTRSRALTVSGMKVEVARMAIKNLHLGVYPPDGRVRVAVPLAVSDSAVRVAVIGKLRRIRRQQATFVHQARQPQRLMVAGESQAMAESVPCASVGRYSLNIATRPGKVRAVISPDSPMARPEKAPASLDSW